MKGLFQLSIHWERPGSFTVWADGNFDPLALQAAIDKLKELQQKEMVKEWADSEACSKLQHK